MAMRSGKGVVLALLTLGIGAAAVAWVLKARPRAEDPGDPRPAGMVAAALRWLPPDSYAVATIPDLTGYGTRFRDSAFGKMVQDPELRAAAGRAFAAPAGSEAASALGGALESLADLGTLGIRS